MRDSSPVEATAAPAPAAYARTDAEQAVITRWIARRNDAAPLPRYTTSDNGDVRFDHPDQGTAQLIIMEALGIAHAEAYSTILQQVLRVTSRDGKHDVGDANALVAMAAGMAPQNQTEGMLAIQAATVHHITMTEAARLHRVDRLPQYEAYANTLNKLARTFTTQIETMKKLRSGGPQRVVVEHKHYHLHQAPDGPAGGGVATETEHQPHVRSLPEREAVLGYVEADRASVQGAGRDRV